MISANLVRLITCTLCFYFLSAERAAAQSYKINTRSKIYAEEISKDSIVIKGDNDLFIPITMRIDFTAENLTGTFPTGLTAVIPAKTIGHPIRGFKKIKPEIPYKYSYASRTVLGDTSKTPDRTYLYAYPFANRWAYKISQWPGGRFSHKNQFAYDFAMPVGSPIAATREGIVALIKADSNTGGPDPSFIKDGNYICIYHSDGTIANYLHLDTNGALVREGDYVKKGQLIAYSGNTGYSTGPHLHFEITQPVLSETKKTVTFAWELPSYNLLSNFPKEAYPENIKFRNSLLVKLYGP